ncbi:hypothetical protein LJ046_07000 [Lactobacillus delbrueckii subsp. jakobsenii ZN7a-9 = DSM 26046]|uniref:hypothetical protein n=1 Tax=Lactobacillus delbrueckii TaxID=1584 RepID=UPI000713A0FF|nr:hypothetical protein [Lactobacillus delbrueckii]APG73387.1 hypothetical protein LJ046_07000 [Lactobacillus delbrueckii subsp. jakobsenii ZN7a-9 = DSM 26046]KRO16853.1 hypothetical protein IV58_GL001091 [Lactobacillus delbrueckii subsp. jakobsenii ZN7a-9 = DSM 26046]TDG65164.1 hypothetical protein C5L19_000912 [Lactobacillus delbrueckii subsp. jakobsenii]
MAEKQYDFTHVPKRQGNSIKWGGLKEKELPMWIAEMDFVFLLASSGFIMTLRNSCMSKNAWSLLE